MQGEYQFSVQTKNKVNNKLYSIVSRLKFKFIDVLTFSIVLEITLSYFSVICRKWTDHFCFCFFLASHRENFIPIKHLIK